MSFYLKYRPQTVEELDLASVRESLGAILKSGKFAHAYLFSGPKGTGKTSSARILAKVLNCEKNHKKDKAAKTGLNEPCNECVSCRKITNGASLAVMEMDGASNRGIDDIRLLREKISLAPADGDFAVYVIDEVHMLTTEAFNALLKTLEEPPGHAVFVLCTTEAHKLPETIISRCTRVDFHKASEAEVMRSLNKAVVGEKLKIKDEPLQLIARKVDGSFRDGMKILEQLSYQGKEITTETVNELLGLGRHTDPEGLIKYLLSKKVEKALAEISQREELGVDLVEYGKRLLEGLRQELLGSVNSGNEDVGTFLRLIDLMSKAVLEMKRAVITQLPLEAAVVDWCMEGDMVKDEKVNAGAVAKSIDKEPNVEKLLVKKRVGLGTSGKQMKSKSDVRKKVSVETSEVRVAGKGVSLKMVEGKWADFMKAIRPHNHSLEALLRAAKPMKMDNNNLVLEVFYNFHKEQLEQERHRRILEKVLSDVMEAGIRLEFELGERASKAKVQERVHTENVTGSLEDEELAKAAEEIFG